ncbi:MAG: class I SAM-dependent methyltransferase [Thermodesulfobacteriota bacterium]
MNPLPKSPFPPYLALFIDNPVRRLLIDRERYLRERGVKEGDHVLEVGCGPGFFTEVLSRIVGEQGRVYAQDVEEGMVRRVKRKLKRFDCRNVELLLCNSTAIELPDDSCDVAFCANVFEEIYKEGELAGSVKDIDRVLKRGGILIIKEHRPGGTRKIIEETIRLLIGKGYSIIGREETLLSLHIRLIKGSAGEGGVNEGYESPG